MSDSAVRDGLQNVRQWIPTKTKLEMVDKIVAAGITEIQAASFVHPKAVPQMQDGEDVFLAVTAKYPDVRFSTLVANLRGVERALSVNARYIGGGCSTTEEHNQGNFNMSINESFRQMKEMLAIKGDAQFSFSQICSFVCPFTGTVRPITAIQQLGTVLDLGITGLCVCDTTGTADPSMIRALLKEFKAAFPGVPMPSVHFHDTYGMGMANTLAALEMGVENFSTVTGGIGGCPYTPGAMGNIATEDMVGMFHSMGIETGIDLDKLLKAAVFIRSKVGNCSTASSHRALIEERKGNIGRSFVQ